MKDKPIPATPTQTTPADDAPAPWETPAAPPPAPPELPSLMDAFLAYVQAQPRLAPRVILWRGFFAGAAAMKALVQDAAKKLPGSQAAAYIRTLYDELRATNGLPLPVNPDWAEGNEPPRLEPDEAMPALEAAPAAPALEPAPAAPTVSPPAPAVSPGMQFDPVAEDPPTQLDRPAPAAPAPAAPPAAQAAPAPTQSKPMTWTLSMLQEFRAAYDHAARAGEPQLRFREYTFRTVDAPAIIRHLQTVFRNDQPGAL